MTKFDDARLSELLEIFGPEDLAIVVDAFLEEAEQAVAGLSDLIGSGPSTAREELMHYLVGAARNLGAVEFGALCKRHQLSDAVFSPDDHAELRESFRETAQAFAHWLNMQATSAA